MSEKTTYSSHSRKSAGTKSLFIDSTVKLIHSGPEFFDLLEKLIGDAICEIHLQFYIFSDDAAGWRIGSALRKAAERGVKIYLLVDGFESRSLSADFLNLLSAANLHFERFEPLFRSEKFYVGRRLHHKLCVFDGTDAIVGGINIADRYLGTETAPPWLDFALYVKGAAAGEVRAICTSYWKGFMISPAGKPGESSMQPEGLRLEPSHCSVRIRRNDWVKAQNEVWKGYFELFNQASESIVVMCSYFLPGWTFLRLIKKAIARGVNVKVILAGVSDVMLAKYAERYLYRWMLRNGVEIYEYKRSVLHAKVAVRDHKWMTIGSYNVNNISALASIECNIEVRNKPFTSKAEQELLAIAAEHCERISYDNFTASQNILNQLWQWCSYQIIKVVLFLATFYFKQER